MRAISIILVAVLAVTALATAQEKPEPDFEELFGTEVLRVFDIRDLTARGQSSEELADHLRKSFEEGLKTVTVSKGQVLVVVAAPEVQQEIAELLTLLRKSLARAVSIESRFVVIPACALSAEERSCPRFLDEAATEKLLRLVEKSPNATLTHAPKITCYDGQRAEIRMGAEVSAVSDFEVERSLGGTILVDPVVERIFAGLAVKLRPVVSIDQKFVTLIFEVRNSKVATGKDNSLDEKGKPGLKVSEVRESRVRTSVTIPDGSTVMLDLGRLPGAKGDEVTLLLVRAVVMQLDEEGIDIDLVPREGEDIGLEPRKDK